MKAELVASGWTLLVVAFPAYLVALVTAVANSHAKSDRFDPKAAGWCIALIVVAVICGLVGVTILSTLSALT